MVMGLLVGSAWGEVVTFAWDPHEQIDQITHFKFLWSDQAGGPHVFLVDVPKADVVNSSRAIDATVTGPGQTTITKYFVLQACGDVLLEDGVTENQCSGNSNEVSHGFWIPFEGFKVPINFIIQPKEQ